MLDFACLPKNQNLYLLLEIKSEPTLDIANAVKQVIEQVRGTKVENRTVLHSFDWNLLEECHRVAPEINDLVLPSEIGNTTMLTERLLKNFGINDSNLYISLEDVVSGSAISKTYESISGSYLSAEEVVALFINNDEDAQKVIEGFTISLAETISDLALIFISGNGIYLAGGLIRTVYEIMNKELFIKSFLSNKKPIHKDMLNLMPIGVVNREYTCLYGNLNFYNLRNN